MAQYDQCKRMNSYVSKRLSEISSFEELGMLETHARLAVQAASGTTGSHLHVLSAKRNLMTVLAAQHKFDEAVTVGERALEQARSVVGAKHEMTLAALKDVTSVMLEKRAFGAATPLLREAMECARDVFGDEHPEALSATMLLGQVLGAQGHAAEAHPLLRSSWERSRRLYGDSGPTLVVGSNLASVLMELGGYCEAEALLEWYVELSERAHGPGGTAHTHEAKVRLERCRAAIAKSWWYQQRTPAKTRKIVTLAERVAAA